MSTIKRNKHYGYRSEEKNPYGRPYLKKLKTVVSLPSAHNARPRSSAGSLPQARGHLPRAEVGILWEMLPCPEPSATRHVHAAQRPHNLESGRPDHTGWVRSTGTIRSGDRLIDCLGFVVLRGWDAIRWEHFWCSLRTSFGTMCLVHVFARRLTCHFLAFVFDLLGCCPLIVCASVFCWGDLLVHARKPLLVSFCSSVAAWSEWSD
jgi:hypothetical protein